MYDLKTKNNAQVYTLVQVQYTDLLVLMTHSFILPSITLEVPQEPWSRNTPGIIQGTFQQTK